MATYPDFRHGAYGQVNANGLALSGQGANNHAIVYIGTAPVNQVEGGAENVNKPILARNIADAKEKLGYSDDWASYTLCEAMHAHFELNQVGPLVFINVLDPVSHKADEGSGDLTLKPQNGRVQVVNVENAILDSLVVKSGEDTKEKGKDYTAAYDSVKKSIIITERTKGALGTEDLTVTYDKVDPSKVKAADVIGSTDGLGLNKGVYAVANVYSLTAYIPAYIVAPGFSSMPDVHAAMAENSQQIAKHWNAWMYVDLPLVDDMEAPLTLENAAEYKASHGYNRDNEDVYFPVFKGTDGRIYHGSVLAAANFQTLLIQNSGIPYMTASNTACPIIQDLYFGETENAKGRVYTDNLINSTLNANGINSAAFVSGQWVIWGMFAGSYNQNDATTINVNDTCLMMLQYLTNDFQHRRNKDIDKPMTLNDLQMIVAEEQSRVDALLGIGALSYGKVTLDASRQAKSDIYSGDFRILFNVTNTPLAKSLTAVANWTADGYNVYFEAMEAAL